MIVACFTEVEESCLTSVQMPYMDCVMPLYGKFFGLSTDEIRRKLTEISLQNLCR